MFPNIFGSALLTVCLSSSLSYQIYSWKKHITRSSHWWAFSYFHLGFLINFQPNRKCFMLRDASKMFPLQNPAYKWTIKSRNYLLWRKTLAHNAILWRVIYLLKRPKWLIIIRHALLFSPSRWKGAKYLYEQRHYELKGDRKF